MPEPRKLRVFISHGNYNKPVVHRLYERLLKEDWIEPWMDEKNLLPGEDRELKVEETLKTTDLALICLSKQSLGEEGGFHQEMKFVVKLEKEKPEGSIFIIPVRLDDCEIPQYLSSKQPVDLYISAEDMGRAYDLIRKSMETKFDLVSGKTAESRSAHWPFSRKDNAVEDLVDLTFGGFSFVKIPKGKFIMGSRASNILSGDDEHPQRPYEIPYNYWISYFPISNEQFGEYAVSTQHIELLSIDWKEKLSQPMVNVSWHEAVEYINWLNRIFRKEIPSRLVFRLPTEAEWEKASRGDFGREWPWGNETLDEFLDHGRPELLVRLKKKIQLDEMKHSDSFGDYFTNGSKVKPSEVGNDPEKAALDLMRKKLAELRRSMELADVGIFSPITDSPHEIGDMIGAIGEWTQSLNKPYPYDVDDGREDLKDPGERVVRGVFETRSERFSVRSAKRAYALPDIKGKYLGFRIVIAPPVS